MSLRHLIPALALTATAALSPLAATAAAPARANFAGKVEPTGPDSGRLKVHYSCNVGQVLWISAKQSADGSVDPRLEQEGSSQLAATWQHSHRNPIVCDGRQRTQVFTVDEQEWGGKGALRKGKAWVQFCITYGDETAGGLEVSESAWVTVG
jgi:hypothetical protein